MTACSGPARAVLRRTGTALLGIATLVLLVYFLLTTAVVMAGEADESNPDFFTIVARGPLDLDSTTTPGGLMIGSVALAFVLIWILVVLIEVTDVFAARLRTRTRPGLGDGWWSAVDVTWAGGELHRLARRRFVVDAMLAVASARGVVAATSGHVASGALLTAAGLGVSGVLRRRRRPLAGACRRRLSPAGLGWGAPAVVLVVVAVACFTELAELVAVGGTGDVLRTDRLRATLLLLAMVVVLAAAALLWRLAVQACAVVEPEGDGAGELLYLRAFKDDRLRLRGASYARVHAVDRFSFRRRQRYEELVAGELGRFASVVAVGEPGRARAPLGARRVDLDATRWQPEIEVRMEHARAIVVVLGRGAGLDWEFGRLAASGSWTRCVVLVPPVREAELVARWEHMAALLARHGLGPLPLPEEPAQLLAVSFTPDGRCRFYIAWRPTVWSVKVAASAALADVKGRANVPVVAPA